MSDPTDFNFLVEKAMQVTGHTHMRPVIAKELLHYDILFSLDKDNLLDQLTFQGGTCLRLCYKASRFSEDLDFVGGRNFKASDLHGIRECLQKHIGERYGLDISVKEPKGSSQNAGRGDVKLAKWQIAITTSPERKDLPKQKVKIEVANLPAYSSALRTLQTNYDFLPDGYSDMLIKAETLDEIMADKLIALVNCMKYIRYRDIWDLRWLKQQGAKINLDFVANKLIDYQVKDYNHKIDEFLSILNSIIFGKAFADEMSRFIPLDIQQRTFKKSGFLDFLENEIRELLLEVKKSNQ